MWDYYDFLVRRMVTPGRHKRISAEFRCLKRQRLSWGWPGLSQSGSFYPEATLACCKDPVSQTFLFVFPPLLFG